MDWYSDDDFIVNNFLQIPILEVQIWVVSDYLYEERVILLVRNHSNLHYEQKVKKSPKKHVNNPAHLLETKE